MSVIDGRIVMENFKVQTVDEKKVVKEAQEAASKMENEVSELFSGMEDTPLMRMMKNGEL